MALIECPECQSQVSDQAPTCPHCGYPICSKKEIVDNIKIEEIETKDGKATRSKKNIVSDKKTKRIDFKIITLLFSLSLIIFSIFISFDLQRKDYQSTIFLEQFTYVFALMGGNALLPFIISYFMWRFSFKKKKGSGLLCFAILLFI